MQSPDIILSRVEHLNEGLSHAVQKPDGAQFALMLSMIWDSRDLTRNVSNSEAVPSSNESEPQRNDLYTPALVARLNESFRAGLMGDVHLQLSWLDTAPLRKRASAVEGAGDVVSLPQAAVMAKQYTVLDEVKDSQHRVAA